MGWALIFMTCSRLCTPQYVELYPTRDACVLNKPKESFWGGGTTYCVPVAKDFPQTK